LDVYIDAVVGFKELLVGKGLETKLKGQLGDTIGDFPCLCNINAIVDDLDGFERVVEGLKHAHDPW